MELLSSLSKSATKSGLEISEWMLIGFGVLLVIGLVGEIRTASLSPRYKKFEWLVVIGVFGELLGDGGIFLLSSQLQAISEIEIVDVKTQAGLALDRAIASEKEAALQLAKAKEDLSPWNLDVAAQDRIIEKLKVFAGTPCEFLVDSHPYAVDLFEKLARSIVGAGWGAVIPGGSLGSHRISPVGARAIVVSARGVTIEIPPRGTPATEPLPPHIIMDFTASGQALLNALVSEGLPTKAVMLKSGDKTRGTKPGAIHVIVGRKP